MKESCNHIWKFTPKSCCDKSFTCIKLGCAKITKASRINGFIDSGDIASIDDQGVATKIAMQVDPDYFRKRKKNARRNTT